MSLIELRVGDAIDELRKLPSDFVNCIVTSPPYWGLRDYGVEGQLGLEPTPDLYLAQMVTVFEECRRVLRRDGTCWVVMGDSYFNPRLGGSRGKSSGLNSSRAAEAVRDAKRAQYSDKQRIGAAPELSPSRRSAIPGLKPKDLVGMPWRLALALQAAGWYLRRDVIWEKATPMPESVRDRPTTAHEYLFMLTRSEQYRYDAQAIAQPVTGGSHPRGKLPANWGAGKDPREATSLSAGRQRPTPKARLAHRQAWLGTRLNPSFDLAVRGLVENRNARSVWKIRSEPFRGDHFATFPRELVRRCIKAGCPANGRVLDPFAGSGTVGIVAAELQRDAVLIELSPKYAQLALDRIRRSCGLLAQVSVIAEDGY